jgi:hypothetical protein
MTPCAGVAAVLCATLAAPVTAAQTKQPVSTPTSRTVLGHLGNGATVTFVRAGSRDWGIDISGAATPHLAQATPAQIEIYRADETVQQLAVGYGSLRKEADTVLGTAKAAGRGGASFLVEDRWKISGTVLSLHRSVRVTGTEAGAGFFSGIRLVTDRSKPGSCSPTTWGSAARTSRSPTSCCWRAIVIRARAVRG